MQMIIIHRNVDCDPWRGVDDCPVDIDQLCVYLLSPSAFLVSWCVLQTLLWMGCNILPVLSLIHELNKIFGMCLFHIYMRIKILSLAKLLINRRELPTASYSRLRQVQASVSGQSEKASFVYLACMVEPETPHPLGGREGQMRAVKEKRLHPLLPEGLALSAVLIWWRCSSLSSQQGCGRTVGPALPWTSCVTLGKSLSPLSLHLQNERPELNYHQGPCQC